MKDVGLDELDGYNTVNETSGDIVTSTVPNAIITSQSPANMVTTQLTFAASGGNQIVAQIPQQIVQVNLHFYWKNIAKKAIKPCFIIAIKQQPVSIGTRSRWSIYLTKRQSCTNSNYFNTSSKFCLFGPSIIYMHKFILKIVKINSNTLMIENRVNQVHLSSIILSLITYVDNLSFVSKYESIR